MPVNSQNPTISNSFLGSTNNTDNNLSNNNVFPARVLDINLTPSVKENSLFQRSRGWFGISSITFEPIGSSTIVNKNPQGNIALPLDSNYKKTPLVNEIVMIMGGPKDTYNELGAIGTYYLPPLNIFGSPHHNAFPNELSDNELKLVKETGEVSQRNYFQEIEKIRPLQPYLGDVTLEGRYGQSIRFGSTISGSHVLNNWSNEGEQGNPITIIRNGQTEDPLKANFEHILEDVNTDNSSIYLCSNQQITNFQKAGISPNNHPTSYKHML